MHVCPLALHFWSSKAVVPPGAGKVLVEDMADRRSGLAVGCGVAKARGRLARWREWCTSRQAQ